MLDSSTLPARADDGAPTLERPDPSRRDLSVDAAACGVVTAYAVRSVAIVGSRCEQMGEDLPMASFESVAGEYDVGRPGYPPGVYDTLGPLEGLVVLDVGAGTGIATSELPAREPAMVVAVDPGKVLLDRAAVRTPSLRAVQADGVALPVRDGVIDLVCFAQSWHWVDEATRVGEAHRVLGPKGRWAGWWSHARADGEDWFDTYWSTIERPAAGTHRGQRDTDWGATVVGSDLFALDVLETVPWLREITVDLWMTDQLSHSYVVALSPPDRDRLTGTLRGILDERFGDGTMAVRYETWLWIARRT